MQQRHKNLDVSGRICITPNNKVFLGGHHHQAAAALACLIRVRKKTKTPKLFDHSSFTLRMYQIPFEIGFLGHEFSYTYGCLWHPIILPFGYGLGRDNNKVFLEVIIIKQQQPWPA